MVADLKTVAVEGGDLFPGEVVALVGAKRETLGDEKGGVETESFQERCGDGSVGGGGVVEGEDNELVGHGQRGECEWGESGYEGNGEKGSR